MTTGEFVQAVAQYEPGVDEEQVAGASKEVTSLLTENYTAEPSLSQEDTWKVTRTNKAKGATVPAATRGLYSIPAGGGAKPLRRHVQRS